MKLKLIGISGCSCSGKTTLAEWLVSSLPAERSIHINMDNFYLPKDSNHLLYLSDVKSFNFESIKSLDLDRFHRVLQELVTSNRYEFVIIEGFLLFEDTKACALFDQMYFLTLDRDECLRRRKLRSYELSDSPGYFEKYVWPSYLVYVAECGRLFADRIVFLDGTRNRDNLEFILANLMTINNN